MNFALLRTAVRELRPKAILVEGELPNGRPVRSWIPRWWIAPDSGIPREVAGTMIGTLVLTAKGREAFLRDLGIADGAMPTHGLDVTHTASPARIRLLDTRPPPQITGSIEEMGGPLFPVWEPTWPRTVRVHGAAPPPTEEQEAGIQRLLAGIASDRREQIVVGSAGTGKTTLLRVFGQRAISEGRNFHILAPTGRAALRAREVTGFPARTIHGALYRGILTKEERVTDAGGNAATRYTPVFHSPGPPCAAGDVVAVDEGSMVGKRVYDDLLKAVTNAGGYLVVFGDRGQLEPVKDTWGPDLLHPDVELTQIHRQAEENPIIQLANAYRYGRAYTPPPNDPRVQHWRNCGTSWYPAMWYAERLRRDPTADIMVLCYENALRRAFNAQIRFLLGHVSGRYDAWTADRMIVPGDRLVVRSNNHYRGWMNGDAFTVESVHQDATDANVRRVHFVGQAAPARIVLGLIGAEAGAFGAYTQEGAQRLRRLMGEAAWNTYKAGGGIPPHLSEEFDVHGALTHVDYGFARTVHLAQGSQAREVGFLVDASTASRLGSQQGRRIAYTAVTRAEEIYYHWGGLP